VSVKQLVTTTPDGKLKFTIPEGQMTAEEKDEAVAQLLACGTYRETMEEIYSKGGRCGVCGYTRADLSRNAGK